ncbi:MAG TPA: hypothetical protein VIQ31_38600 [Phormidium sp.]
MQSNNVEHLEGGLQYLVVKPLGICLEGLNGKPLLIHGCSLEDLKKLSAMMDVLWREANSFSVQQPDATLQEVFHHSTLFQQISLQAIELCGISPKQVDLNMLICLLFPFEFSYKELNKETEQVEIKRQIVDGILNQVNFPRSTSPTLKHIPDTNKKGKQANWNDMYASLWMSSKSLEHAMQASRTLPWNELSQAMLSRNETISEALMSQEEREAKEAKEAFNELMQKNESLAREFGQLNGKPRFIQDEAVDQDAQEQQSLKEGLQKEHAAEVQAQATKATLGLTETDDFFSLIDNENFGLGEDGDFADGFRGIQPTDW